MGAGLFALEASHAVPRSAVAIELVVNVAIGVLLYVAALFLISRRTFAEIWSAWRLLRTRK